MSVFTPEVKEHNMDTKEILCLKELRELIQDDRELDKFAEFLDNRFLLHFVRGKKVNTEKAFNCLKGYIKVRKQYPEFFKSLDANKTEDVLLRRGKNIINLLKSEDLKGNIVIVIKVDAWDPTLLSLEVLYGALLMAIEYMWNDEYYEKKGVAVIYDLENFNFTHITAITPYAVKQFLSIFVNAQPVRVKGVYFMNMSYLPNLLYKFAKTLLPKKLKSRLHVYTASEMHILQEHFSVDTLPEFLGGNLTENESYVDLREIAQELIQKQGYYDKFAELL